MEADSDALIRVHIERLILEGIDVAHRERPLLQQAVEAELGRLLATTGIAPELQADGAYPSGRAGAIQLPQPDTIHLGQQIAQAIYQGLGQ
ncbi:MAG: hypothetical protein L0332_30165 [Chloroflexi bacterium]|nr:hypothetical protein [Chloroflexota bacterium]MCI0575346.1 hypothetical protein [Chloroflexota bacterium]MCI0645820.1 hypothetical protein [Chloroflexota bacterium]MCI0730968.1 hypothetical protein [Chloroflexota bacterium]